MPKIKILNLSDIDIDRLDLTKIDNKNGLIYIQYCDDENRRIPCMLFIDYLYISDNIKNINSKYISHELILPLISTNERYSDEVSLFFTQLDSKLIEDGKKNINNWPFNSNKIKYKMIVKNMENDDSKMYENGLIKLKLINSNSFKTVVYDDDKKKIPLISYDDCITSGKYVKMIIELSSIWFKNGIYGLYMKPHQLKISNSKQFRINLDIYSFNNDSDDSDDDNNENDNIICETEVMETENNSVCIIEDHVNDMNPYEICNLNRNINMLGSEELIVDDELTISSTEFE